MPASASSLPNAGMNGWVQGQVAWKFDLHINMHIYVNTYPPFLPLTCHLIKGARKGSLSSSYPPAGATLVGGSVCRIIYILYDVCYVFFGSWNAPTVDLNLKHSTTHPPPTPTRLLFPTTSARPTRSHLAPAAPALLQNEEPNRQPFRMHNLENPFCRNASKHLYVLLTQRREVCKQKPCKIATSS